MSRAIRPRSPLDPVAAALKLKAAMARDDAATILAAEIGTREATC